AEAGHGIKANDGKASGRKRSDDGCWQRDVMSEIGLHASVELAHLAQDRDKVARIEAATTPGDRVQVKPLGLDGSTMPVDAGGDVHLEAGVASRARHRQAMGDEVPILGHEV